MKSIIVLLMVVLVHARCDWPVDVGIWHPKPGQNFGIVMADLEITEQDIQFLNPATNLDRIYPEVPYNVTFKASLSGKWTKGCPSSLVIPNKSGPLVPDTSSGEQETSIDTDSDDGRGDRSSPTTHTIQETVEAPVRTTTPHASDPSSPSMTISSGYTHTPYRIPAESKESGQESEGYPTTTMISDDASSAASRPATSSAKDKGSKPTHSEEHGQVDTSKTSDVNQSTDKVENASTTGQDKEDKELTTSENAVPSYGTVVEETTGESKLPDAISTDTAIATTDTPKENDQASGPVTDTSSLPLSITTAIESNSVSTSTPSQTGASDDGISEGRSATSSGGESAASSVGESNQIPPTGTETGLSSTVAETTDTTTVDDIVSSVTTTSAKTTSDSTKEASTTATNPSTKPTSTLVTSTTKANAKGTTTRTSVDWKPTEVPKASCLWGENIGPVELNEDMVLSKVEEFCNRSQVDNRLKFDDDDVKYSFVDESDVKYDFKICPENRCPDYGQNMKDPLGDGSFTCSIIFFDLIWRSCKFCILSKRSSS